MLVITQDAVAVCDHQLGQVVNQPSQTLFRIEGRQVLVDNDPVGRAIMTCPNIGSTVKPCMKTVSVSTGYSSLVRVNGDSVCLDTVRGLTDGTPPGTVNHSVRSPGQVFVTISE